VYEWRDFQRREAMALSPRWKLNDWLSKLLLADCWAVVGSCSKVGSAVAFRRQRWVFSWMLWLRNLRNSFSFYCSSSKLLWFLRQKIMFSALRVAATRVAVRATQASAPKSTLLSYAHRRSVQPAVFAARHFSAPPVRLVEWFFIVPMIPVIA